ncbi:MAG: TFIIB-type zinc ribbon-containing protein [Lachnospiraceae bacterium]|nr:TFIIB-type zinc ribbon-containing protein [Lachnospiraceae bacterium]
MNSNTSNNIFNNYDDCIPPTTDTIVHQTDTNQINGQRKCPTCGGTDIIFNKKLAKLMCSHCKHEFIGEKIEDLDINIRNLNGRIIASGAANIEQCDNLVTLKCSSCGAEITIDSSKSHQIKCHWCRNTLSLNKQMANGSIPDIILPFTVTHDEAYELMNDFLKTRKSFAKRDFKKNFKKKNIIGVFFPYMNVDINSHIHFKGEGENKVVHYIKDAKDIYDIKLYSVAREYDLIIDNLIIESSWDKIYNAYSRNTNNIINSILPFDIENAVKWAAAYVKDYNIEKRDANIMDIRPSVYGQVKDIVHSINKESTKEYDVSLNWDTEDIDIKGEYWQAAYLPVWLYTYCDKTDGEDVLHYIAVNGRTKETMGSVPYSKTSAKIKHYLILLLLILITIFTPLWNMTLIGFIAWAISYFSLDSTYRNSYARHEFETETKKEILNAVHTDTYIKTTGRM